MNIRTKWYFIPHRVYYSSDCMASLRCILILFTDVNTNTCIYVIRRVVDLQSFRTLYIKTTVDGMLAEMATIVYVIHWLI